MPDLIGKVKHALHLGGMEAPKVRIYTQPTCPACHSAKAYLDQKGVPYQDIDITKDHEALHAMIHLSGVRATPVLVIGDRVLTGEPDPAAIDEALKAAGLL
jgi:glutaredoxin-like YruB-family protein